MDSWRLRIALVWLWIHHHTGVMMGLGLRDKMGKLISLECGQGKAATVEGLRQKEYHELVCCVLPHDIVESLYPEEFYSKAG